MTQGQRIETLEKEMADLKRQLEDQPKQQCITPNEVMKIVSEEIKNNHQRFLDKVSFYVRYD